VPMVQSPTADSSTSVFVFSTLGEGSGLIALLVL